MWIMTLNLLWSSHLDFLRQLSSLNAFFPYCIFFQIKASFAVNQTSQLLGVPLADLRAQAEEEVSNAQYYSSFNFMGL